MRHCYSARTLNNPNKVMNTYMKTRNYILLTIICFAASINVFSQAKQISKEDYYQPYREALSKKDDLSRRNLTKQENYRDGKLFSTTEITDEYLKPDRRHYLEVEKFADYTNKDELIKIGKIYYCRRNDGEWKQYQSWCSGGSASGLSNIVSSEYTVEDSNVSDQKVKLYRNYTTYKNTYSPDKDKEGLSYSESKYWLDKNGFILRQEIKSGLLEPQRIYRQQTDSYEYNPKNLKIEAPIK